MDKVYLVRWEERGWEPDSGIVDVCATEEIALVVKKNWEKENPEDNVWVEPWDIETEMPRNLKDFNRHEVKLGEKFKMNNSDHIFTIAKYREEEMIVDLMDNIVYDLSTIFVGDTTFFFFEKPDDDDFLGVEVIEDE